MGCAPSTNSSDLRTYKSLPIKELAPLTTHQRSHRPDGPVSQDKLAQLFASSNILLKFLQIENAIMDNEKKFLNDNFHVKSEQFEQLEQSMTHLKESYEEARNKVDILKRKYGFHVNSTKELLTESSQRESTSEEDEFLDVLNKQEILERELNAMIKQRQTLEDEIVVLKKRGQQLNELHGKREEILDTVFDGFYGSDLEQALEKELDWLLEQKHHVDQAHFRWSQARSLISEASLFVSKAITKWSELPAIAVENLDKRYTIAADTRNLLVAASQNVYAALRYLPNIELPYCSMNEIEVLDKAITYIFTDMATPDRFSHALECYSSTLKRISALRQWIHQVIKTTIARDLFEVQETCKQKELELREERVKLIRARVESITGVPLESLQNQTPSSDLRDSGFDSELEESIKTDEISRLFSETRSSGTPDPTPVPLVMPTPVPSADLAPMPSDEEIFGKIELLRQKHRQDVREFNRSRKIAQARVTQGLKDKLNERRSRRSRLDMHSRQLEALKEH